MADRKGTTSTGSAAGYTRSETVNPPAGLPCLQNMRSRCLASTALTALTLLLIGTGTPASANPTSGVVVAGAASVAMPSPSTLNITQSSQRAIIDWGSFSIAAGETTRFIQPDSSAFALNRVIGADPSVIAGNLFANGNIALVNRSGVYFSRGSLVDVNSLIVTTADIADGDFMAGRLNFSIPTTVFGASVANDGLITIADRGLAAFVAPSVANSGVIEAKLGQVVLGGANRFTVDLYGDGLVSLDVTDKVTSVPASADGTQPAALVSNTGTITADGGHIILSAAAVDTIVSDVVNAGGKLQARGATGHSGTIEIVSEGGGTTSVTGTLDVSAAQAGATGGAVSITGPSVSIAGTAVINASGAAGGGTVKIGGGEHGTDTSIANAQTTTVAAGAAINASATDTGKGGTVVVWSDLATSFAGSIVAKGGVSGGDGGFVETSSKGALGIPATALVDVGATNGKLGEWLLDPTDITISTAASSTTITTTSPIEDNGSGTGSDNVANTVIDAALATGDVVITTHASGTAAAPNGGQITLNADIVEATGSSSLGLNADTGIVLNANINFVAGTGNVYLAAGGAVTRTSGTISLDTGSLSITAGSGVGTSAAPITTAGLTNFAATTTTGGIFVTNGGGSAVDIATVASKTISGITFAAVSGLSAPTGDIAFSNVGGTTTLSGTYNSAGFSITGAVLLGAAVTVNAGADGTSFTSTVDGAQVLTVVSSGGVAFGGAIGGTTPLTGLSVTGSGVSLGAAATVAGNVSLTADNLALSGALNASGHTVNLQPLTTSDGVDLGTQVTTGDLVLSTALLNEITAGTLAIGAFADSGTLTVNTALAATAGGALHNIAGTLTLIGGTGTIDVTAAGTITVPTGTDISLNADSMSLGAAITSSSEVTILPSTANRAVNLGGATDPGTDLYLNTAALGEIHANTLSVGTADGALTVTGALDTTTALATITNLDLVSSGGPMTISAPISLASTGVLTFDSTGTVDASGGALTVSGAGSGLQLMGTGGAYTLTNAGNSITTLAANTGSVAVTDSSALTINTVEATSNLTATGPVTLTADSLTLTATTGQISAAGQTVTIAPLTATTAVNIGGTPATGLFLTTTELGEISAGTLVVGSLTDTAQLTVTGALAPAQALAGVTNLSLLSGAGGIAVDNAITLASTGVLTLNSTGTVDASGGALTVSGGGSGVQLLGAGGTFTLTNAGNSITTVAANTGSLTLNDGGNALTIGSVGTTTGLTLSGSLALGDLAATSSGLVLAANVTVGGGAVDFSAATTGAAGIVVTAGATINTSTDGGDITLGPVNDGNAAGTDSLTLAAGTGTVTLGGAIGPTAALNSLTVTGSTISVGPASTSGDQSYTGATTLSGTYTTNGFTVMGATTLGGSVAVTAGADGTDFTSTINGAHTLGISDGTGAVTFGGAIGGNTALASITASGSTISVGPASTSGDQSYTGATTLSGTYTTNGFTVTGATTLGGSVAVTAGADGTDFTSTINGAHTLGISDGTGAVTFGGAIGGNTALASVTATGLTISVGSASASGDQSYTGATTLNGTYTTNGFTVTGAATLDGSVAVTAGADGTDFTNTINGAHTLGISDGTGAVTFGGAIGGNTALASVTVTGSTISVGSASTTGDQSYSGATTLNGTYTTDGFTVTGAATLASNITVTAGADGTDFTSTINGGHALIVSDGTGAVTFGGAIGGGTPLVSVAATGSTISVGSASTTGDQGYTGATTLSGTYATNGFIVTGAATLGGVVTVNAGADGADFTSTINGAHALGVSDGTGAVTFGGPIGGGTPLASVAATGSTISVGSASTTGDQSYTGATTLSGTYTTNGLTVTGAATLGGVVTVNAGADGTDFTSTIDGAHTLGISDGTGAVTFGGAIGGGTPLASVAVTGATIAVGSASTTGDQSYSGATTLSGSYTTDGFTVTGAATLGGVVTVNAGADGTDFTSTINGAHPLSILDGTGAVAFGGAIGGVIPLTSVTVTGATISVGSASTTGDQSYSGATTLSGSYTTDGFTVTGAATLGGAVGATIAVTAGADGTDFTSTINGAHPLSILDGAGAVTFGGTIGGIIPLTSVTATGATISAQPVTTTGPVTLTTDALTLAGLVTAIGQTVTIAPLSASTAVNVGGTPVTGLVLTTTELNAIHVGSGTLIVGSTADTTGLLTVTGTLASTLGTDALANITNLTLISGAGGITIGQAVTLKAAGVLELDSAGTVDATAGALTVSGTGSGLLLLGGGSFKLADTGNAIGTLAGTVGTLSLVDSTGLTIGTLVANSGLTADGDAAIKAAGTITLDTNVSVGTTHNLLLWATTGDVVEAEPTGGFITAGGLAVNAAGQIKLAQSNTVATLAASAAGGGLAFNDSRSLTIGSVSVNDPSALGTTPLIGVTAGGDTALEAAGSITLASNVSVGTNNLLLDATAGGITETTGLVTANGLILEATGAGDLQLNNAVTTLAASFGSGLAFNDARTLTIGSVTAAPPSFGATLSGVTAAGDTALEAAGSITLASTVSVGTNNLLLDATAGGITETTGLIAANGLILEATGAGDLQLNNVVTTLAASIGGGLAFQDSQALTIGSVTVAPPSFGTTLAGVTAGGDTALEAAGSITLASTVSVGTNNLLLDATAGGITETTGLVTANGLILEATGAGDLQLNNAVTTLAASFGSGLAFNDARTLTIGSVTAAPPSFGATLSGVTAAGDTALEAAGSITLASTVSVGTNNLLLDATAGGIAETTGLIAANGLILEATGAGDLQLNNVVTTLAASIGGGLAFQDSQALTIGSVTVAPPSFGTTLAGVTAGGDTALEAAGSITLASTVSVGTNNLILDATAGGIAETTGLVTANGLILEATGAGDLQLNNVVTTLAASFGSGLAFNDARTLTIGSVTAAPPSFGATLSGVTAAGDTALEAAGSITLASTVSVGTNNLLLDATAGGITETTGLIAANGLILEATGAGDLQLNNVVTTLAASIGGGLAFQDSQALTIGSVTVAPPSFGTTLAGVTAGGDTALEAAGSITLASTVSVGTNNLILDATAGGIAETTGLVTANGLILEATGAGDLQLNNAVTTLAASIGSGLAFQDSQALTIGSVTAAPPSFGATLSGVTAGGDTALEAAGPITLASTVSVGTNNLLLDATAGGITETTGLVTANGLVLEATGAGDLQLNNVVTTLAASIGSGLAFLDSQALTIGSVTAAPPSFGTTLSGVTAGGDTALEAAGSITLASNVSVGTNNLLLDATAGGITETTGLVTANGLVLEATGAGDLQLNNVVTTLAASIGSGLAFNDARALTIGSVAVAPPSFGATLSGVTAGGDTALEAAGSITLASTVSVGTNNLLLDATAGGITETTGLVTANGLILEATGAGDLQLNNVVITLAASIGSGLAFLDSQALTIGSVTVAPPSLGATLSGVTAGGDTALEAAGSITLASNVSVGTNNLLLDATAGGITETTGLVTANGLILEATGAGDLQLNNVVTTLAASFGSGLAFLDSQALTIGSVTVAPPSLGATLSGVTAGGDTALEAAGSITLASTVSVGTNNLILDATAGGITETTGLVTANGLVLEAAGAGDLQLGNVVTTLAANFGSGLAFLDSQALVVGGVTVAPPSFGTTLSGVTAGGDTALEAAGSITLASNVSVGTNNLLLDATAGGITETTGLVTANGLVLEATGAGDLQLGNVVTTLAANFGSGLAFLDSQALVVGGVTVAPPSFGTTLSGVTAGGDTALEAAGSITLASNVSVGTNNLLLDATAGGITETTGLVTANGLVLEATGAGDLQLGNVVTTLAANFGSGLAFLDSQALVVGGVTVAPPSFGTTLSGVTAGGDTALEAAGSITLASTVSVGTNNLILDATAGGIAETTGLVTANGLILEATGAGDLQLNNVVTTLAASIGSGLAFQDSQALTIGSVTAAPPSFGATLSGVTAGGDTALEAAGSITLASNVSVGTNNLLLDATAGGITETTGLVTANGLILEATGAGDLQLNNVVTTLAASIGSGLAFNDARALTIGSIAVAPPSFGTTLAGVIAGGDTALEAAGAITLAGNVSVGTNNLLLDATAGGITETTGLVTANGLILEATGAGDLQLNNAVTTLAASIGGGLAFLDSQALTIGSVTVAPPSFGATLSGVTAGGDTALEAAGSITLAGNVSVGTNNLILDATAGGITETTGLVTANGLILEATGAGDLQLNNVVTTLAASIGGGLAFLDSQALTIGSVTVAPPSFGATLSGVTAGGDTALEAAGSITLASNVSVGTNNLILDATAGGIAETTGLVTANGLILEATGAGDLQLNNVVTTLAASIGSGLAFQDSQALTIGSVTAAPPSFGATLSGVTAGGDTALEAAGSITLASNVSVGTNNLLLDATAGGITETTGLVTATGLILEATGAGDLQLNNVVTTLAASIGSGLAFNDARALTIGSIAVAPPSFGTTLAGVIAGGDTALEAAGAITLAGNVSVGTNNLLLDATAGGITETTGLVTANGLILEATGAGDLQLNNAVTTLAASIGGGLAFLDSQALTIGSVTVAPPSFGATLSGVTAGGDTALEAAGSITLAGNVSVGTNNLILDATAGGITETTGLVTANGLILEATGAGDLQLNNVVTTLAASIGGGLAFLDSQALTIGSVTVAPPSFGATLSGVTAGGDTALEAAGSITLASNVSVGTNNLILDATAGGIAETTGLVTANGLILEATGAGDLQLNNVVTTLAASIGSGLAFQDSQALTIGSVTAAPPSFGATLSGVTAGGDTALEAAGSITLASNVSVGTNNLLLDATAGGITETTGLVTANGLILEATGAGDLQLNNVVTTLAASIGSGLAFQDSQALTIGSVTAAPPSFGATLSGVTAGGDTALEAAGSITLASTVSVGTNNLLLDATAGGIAETTGLIAANGLILEATGAGDLQLNNVVTTLAASIGGGLAFQDSQALTIGSVTVAPPSFGTTLSGVTAGGDTALEAAGSITLASTVSVGTNNLILDATAGGIAETTGLVTASGAAVSASAAIDLQSDNVIAILAAASGGGGIAVASAGSLTIGTVGTTAPSLNLSLTGVVSTGLTGNAASSASDHDIALVTNSGSLTLAANVDALGSGTVRGNVLLEAAQAVIESGGIVRAAGLVVESSSASSLDGLNDLAGGSGAATAGWLAADVAAGGLAFQNEAGFVVAGTPIIVTPPSDGASLANVVTAGSSATDHDIALLTATGSITLAGAVEAFGTGTPLGNVLLTAGSSGSVIETTGFIEASGLIARASGDIDLQSANQIATVAALAGGGISFVDADALTVGAVSVGSSPVSDALGSVVGTSDVALKVITGSLSLAGAVTAPDVLLEAVSGSVAETNAAGLVSATGGLIVRASGNIDMASANLVATLAIGGPSENSTNAAGGGVSFVDAEALTVGPVTVASPSISDALASVAASSDVALKVSSGALSLAGAVTGPDVLLEAVSGSVAETSAAGLVTATGGLIVRASGDIDMQSNNLVATLAVGGPSENSANAAGGTLAFVNAESVAVAPVSIASPSVSDALGSIDADDTIALTVRSGSLTVAQKALVTSGAGDISITSGQNLTILGTVDAGSKGLDLTVAGTIDEQGTASTPSGSIVAATLTGSSGRWGLLDGLNRISTLTGWTAGSGAGLDGTIFGVSSATRIDHAYSFVFNDTVNLSVSGAVTATDSVLLAENIAFSKGMTDTANTLPINTARPKEQSPPALQTTAAITSTNGDIGIWAPGATVDIGIAAGSATPAPGNALVAPTIGSLVAISASYITLGGTSNATTVVADSTSRNLNLLFGINATSFDPSVEGGNDGYRELFQTLALKSPPTVPADTAATVTLMNYINLSPSGNVTSKFAHGLLISSSGGNVTGKLDTDELQVDIQQYGQIVLTGSIRGIASQQAANAAGIYQGPNNNYRFNGCAIGSPSCIVVSLVVPTRPQDIDNFDFITGDQGFSDIEIERLNTGNEDDLLLQGD